MESLQSIGRGQQNWEGVEMCKAFGAKVGCERNQSRLYAAYMKVLKELIKMLKVIQAITCVLYQGLRLYQCLKHIVFPGNLSHRGT